MKKIIILILLITLTGCSLFKEEKENVKEEKPSQEEVQEKEPVIEETTYKDDNQIVISLYTGQTSNYVKREVFDSKLEEYKDIGLFFVILDNKDNIKEGTIKSLYNRYSANYPDFSKYKIGYNVSFKLKNGEEFNENILKPLEFSAFSFSKYLYVWLYDDINNSGWYSHLEPDDYKENTVMSSIKLMATSNTKEIDGDIKLTVFTYDTMEDFDANNNYRGSSSFTTSIRRIG